MTFGRSGWNPIVNHLKSKKHSVQVGSLMATMSEDYNNVISPYIEATKNKMMHYFWCDNVGVLQGVIIQHSGKKIPGFVLVPPDTYMPCQEFIPQSESKEWRIQRVVDGPRFGAQLDKDNTALPHVRMDRGIFFSSKKVGESFGHSIRDIESVVANMLETDCTDDAVIVIDINDAISFDEFTHSPVESYIDIFDAYMRKQNLSDINDYKAVFPTKYVEYDPSRTEDAMLGGSATGALPPSASITKAWELMSEQERDSDLGRHYLAKRTAILEGRQRELTEMENGEATDLAISATPGESGITAGATKALLPLAKHSIGPVPPGWAFSKAASARTEHHAIDVKTLREWAKCECNSAYGFSQETNYGSSQVRAGIQLEEANIQRAINNVVQILSTILTKLFNAFYTSTPNSASFLRGYDIFMIPVIQEKMLEYLERHNGTPEGDRVAQAYADWSDARTQKRQGGARGARKMNKTTIAEKDEDEKEDGEKKKEKKKKKKKKVTANSTLICSIIEERAERIKGMISDEFEGGDGQSLDEMGMPVQRTVASHLIETLKDTAISDMQFFEDAGLKTHGWFTGSLVDALERSMLSYNIVIPEWVPPISLEEVREMAVEGTISTTEYTYFKRNRIGLPVNNIDPVIEPTVEKFIGAIRKAVMASPDTSPYLAGNKRRRDENIEEADSNKQTASKKRKKGEGEEEDQKNATDMNEPKEKSQPEKDERKDGDGIGVR